MTYVPPRAPASVVTLNASDTIQVTQGGVAHAATLATLGGYFSGASGSTGATGGATGSTGGSTGPTESAEAATITAQGTALYDGGLRKFTLVPAQNGLTGLGVALNDTYQTYTANVTKGFIHNHVFWQVNSAGEYYSWDSTNNTYIDQGTGDPTVTSGSTGATGGTSSGAQTATPSTVAGDWAIDLRSATGQTVYGTLYGFGTGALADNGFARTANATIQPAIKKLAPRLFRVNCNANISGTAWQDYVFRNGTGSPDWTGFDPLFDNASKWMPDNCQIMLGIGNGSGTLSASTMAAYATALANRAIAKGRPIRLWEVENERDSLSRSTYNAMFTAVADALHAIDSSYKVFGPVNSYATSTAPDGAIQSLCQAAGNKVGGICYHTYLGSSSTASGWSNDTLYANTLMRTEAQVARQTADGVSATAGIPICIGEWNIIYAPDTSYKQQIQIEGAIYNAVALHRVMDANINAQYGAIWECYGDSTYGQVADPSGGFATDYRVFPPGQYLAYAGQHMDGARVASTWGKGGSILHHACKSGSTWAAQIINYSTSAAQSGTVGITGPASVSSSVTQWQISRAAPNGTTSTLALSALSGSGISLPAESVTILSGTFA